MTYSEGKKSTSSNSAAEERSLYQGHRQRLRQRMEREGWEGLKPYEMLELILYHAVPRQDISGVARLLINRFETLGGVFAADREQLMAVPGVTSQMAEWILITSELVDAYYDLNFLPDIRVSCYKEVVSFLRRRKELLREGGLWMICADFEFNLMCFERVKAQGEWWSFESVQWMVRESLNSNARYIYVILAVERLQWEISSEEAARISAIATTLKAVDVDLVDMILVCGGEARSLRVEGRLNGFLSMEADSAALSEGYVREEGKGNRQ